MAEFDPTQLKARERSLDVGVATGRKRSRRRWGLEDCFLQRSDRDGNLGRRGKSSGFPGRLCTAGNEARKSCGSKLVGWRLDVHGGTPVLSLFVASERSDAALLAALAELVAEAALPASRLLVVLASVATEAEVEAFADSGAAAAERPVPELDVVALRVGESFLRRPSA